MEVMQGQKVRVGIRLFFTEVAGNNRTEFLSPH